MREIKFRAWDKFNKVMTTTFNVSSQGVLTFTPLGQSPIYLKDMILMQYTGLKDKNGKEIYEGDVVRLNRKIFAKHKGNYIGEIGWNKNGFGFDNLRFKCDHCEESDLSPGLSEFLIYPYTDCYEIIGNIYENPKLLETK